MGADVGDQTKAIEILKALPDEAKGYLSHHIRNSVQNVVSAVYMKDDEAFHEAVAHIIIDLERIGV